MSIGTRTAADWVGRYCEDGVFFPIPVLSREETCFFRNSVEDFERRFEARFGRAPAGAEVGQCHLHFEWASRLATDPRLLNIAEAVLGPDILIHSTTIFHKRPLSGTYVTWHQDGYHMELGKPDLLSVWVALSDSNPENGCLRLVPGSHKNGRLPHGQDAVAERNLLTSGLEISVAVDETEATDVVLREGEVSLHHVNIVHGSRPNDSAFSRMGFAIRYAAPHVRQRSAHHPVVLARGEDRFGEYSHYAESPEPDMGRALDEHVRFAQELVAQRVAAGRKT